jgi:hypothetical protein
MTAGRFHQRQPPKPRQHCPIGSFTPKFNLGVTPKFRLGTP